MIQTRTVESCLLPAGGPYTHVAGRRVAPPIVVDELARALVTPDQLGIYIEQEDGTFTLSMTYRLVQAGWELESKADMDAVYQWVTDPPSNT